MRAQSSLYLIEIAYRKSHCKISTPRAGMAYIRALDSSARQRAANLRYRWVEVVRRSALSPAAPHAGPRPWSPLLTSNTSKCKHPCWLMQVPDCWLSVLYPYLKSLVEFTLQGIVAPKCTALTPPACLSVCTSNTACRDAVYEATLGTLFVTCKRRLSCAVPALLLLASVPARWLRRRTKSSQHPCQVERTRL